MTMLNQKQIDEFKKLYLKKYGVRLTDQDATAKAQALFNLVKLALDPLAEDMQL